MTFAKKIRVILWGERPSTHEERKLLFKIDWFVLSFVCLQCVLSVSVRFTSEAIAFRYFSNYLDRANLANAYVSGMKEALNMTGHDFNTVSSMFTVGYTVAQIPQNLLLHVVPPRILFPMNTLIWGSLTMVTAAATNARHLYVIRFFQGVAEASTFVGAHFIMGSWYKESELGKRGAIFSSSAQVATIFSGVLQASIYKNLDGLHGLAGFRWLFIICGLITVPIALYGFFFFPDTPQTTSARYLSPEEKSLAISRLPPKPQTKLDWSLIRRVLGRWRIYAMCLICFQIVGGELESIGSNSLMALWMKASVAPKYSIQNINYYPAGGTALAIVALLATAVWTDYTTKRYQVNFLIAVCMLISSVILLVYTPISTAGKFFAFYLAGVSYAGQASNFGWCNDLARDDDQERSVILAAMNMMSNAFNAWWSIVFFAANDAPRWRNGMISIIILAPILVGLTVGTRILQSRDQRRASRSQGEGQSGLESKDEATI
ncbi:major facilitator superfamily domain-containing protein [Mycena alexandri]|uniref:Major facilitator superfamily domain-containing protein n=1 Tax=Mycena alexandri TaxID=1745969 RepID=A0AAD6XG82_9AGAR|nr:major facilitator superfamily domain-containing protein [Mycena alexandri]